MHPAKFLPRSMIMYEHALFAFSIWNFSPVWTRIVYQKCHCFKHLIFSLLTGSFFFRLTSGSVVSLPYRCLLKLLLPCLAYCSPAPLFTYSLPICNQKWCPSQLLEREFSGGTAGGTGEKRGLYSTESRWAGEEELRLTWKGRDGKWSLLEQAFSYCFCLTAASTTGLGCMFLNPVLIPSMFHSVTFLTLQTTFPEVFFNAV